MNSIGAIIIAGFAVLWVAAGTRNLPAPWRGLLFLIAVLISASVLFAATHVKMTSPATGGFNGQIYGIFVILEVVFIVIAVVLLNRSGRKQYLIPVIAFIVGAHFFGMVPALDANEFWWIGGAMCLLPLFTMSILPENLWAPVVGLGCAGILWFSSIRPFF
jgi:hypothetical protein